MTTNAQHAEQLLAEARTASERRKMLITAATALATTETLPAARQALADLAESGGPPDIVAGAAGVLDALGGRPAGPVILPFGHAST